MSDEQVSSVTFERALDPEHDFILTTHAFATTSDLTRYALKPFDSAIAWSTPRRLKGLGTVSERDRIAFFDIETAGLRPTDPILCAALGSWTAHHPAEMFHVKHAMLFHPRAEREMLRALMEELAQFDALCTYNGKSFDLPRVRARCQMLGIDPRAITRLRHLDLIHVARRHVPRGEVQGKLNLAALERGLLRFHRHDDLPGSEVPGRWHRFLESQRLELLDDLRDHNLLDVVSLASLLELFARGGPYGSQGLSSHPHGQQSLPIASSATAPSHEPAKPTAQPPSGLQAVSPLRRQLQRSYRPRGFEQPDKTSSARRVARLRAEVTLKLAQGEGVSRMMAEICEILALSPDDAEALRWLVACYEDRDMVALAAQLRDRLQGIKS